jgi:riboflavin biosynthesis pyrimidine reductase
MAPREFSAEKLRLKRIYEGPDYKRFTEPAVSCRKVDEVYGPLLFPRLPEDRSYTYASFVMSVDGRIAFPESPDGTLLAKTNKLDPYGGECDFWVLNLLRAASDAIIMGSMTLAREPYLTGRIFDPDLTACRSAAGKPDTPLHVVITRSGANLSLEHKVFRERDIPALIAASPEGAETIRRRFSGEVVPAEPEDLSTAALRGTNKPLLFGFGSGLEFDAEALLAFLKRGGCGRVLIESPSFLSHLMAEKLLDEMFLNTSGIFIGGEALTLGENAAPFSAEAHPHTRTLTIHTHSDSFFYSRYSINYLEL